MSGRKLAVIVCTLLAVWASSATLWAQNGPDLSPAAPAIPPPPPLELQVADAALAGHNAWMLAASALVPRPQLAIPKGEAAESPAPLVKDRDRFIAHSITPAQPYGEQCPTVTANFRPLIAVGSLHDEDYEFAAHAPKPVNRLAVPRQNRSTGLCQFRESTELCLCEAKCQKVDQENQASGTFARSELEIPPDSA